MTMRQPNISVLLSEPSEDARLREAQIKALTAGEPVEIRPLVIGEGAA